MPDKYTATYKEHEIRVQLMQDIMRQWAYAASINGTALRAVPSLQNS